MGRYFEGRHDDARPVRPRDRLKTETNTEAIGQRIVLAAEAGPLGGHDALNGAFEHGQWWVMCLGCGAQWSVVDAEGGPAVDGFDFECVTDGDDTCEVGS